MLFIHTALSAASILAVTSAFSTFDDDFDALSQLLSIRSEVLLPWLERRGKDDLKSSKSLTQRPWQEEKAKAKSAKMAEYVPLPDKPKTRPVVPSKADLQDASKKSTGKGPSSGATTHTWSAAADNYMNKHVDAKDAKKQRADAERVVAESMRYPGNDITTGGGGDAAHSLIRAAIHTTKSTGYNGGLDKGGNVMDKGAYGSQPIVTSVQSVPGSNSATVRHLPVSYDKKGDAHYDPRQKEAKFPNSPNKGANTVPAKPASMGHSFFPTKRDLFDDDFEDMEGMLMLARRAVQDQYLLDQEEQLYRRYLGDFDDEEQLHRRYLAEFDDEFDMEF